MTFKSLFNYVFLLSGAMFCRCFPFSSLRSVQPPPPQQTPVAFVSNPTTQIRAQNNVGPTSDVGLINKWRDQLQTYVQASEEKIQLTTLQNDRVRYLSQKPDADLYQCFINSKRVEVFESSSSFSLEKHHIQPRFDGGGNERENLIFLTAEEHTLAHFLRYLEYGKSHDASVVLFRCGYSEEARRLVQKQALAKMKEEQKGRWNPTAQSELGKKGGQKGGSANTQAQFTARQNVGKTYGQKTGLGNQSATLQTILHQNLEWVHETCPDQKFVTTPSKSGKEIIDQLEKYVPNQIRNNTTFYKVLHGNRSGMYGWVLVGKGIRSEAEGGEGPSERSETST